MSMFALHPTIIGALGRQEHGSENQSHRGHGHAGQSSRGWYQETQGSDGSPGPSIGGQQKDDPESGLLSCSNFLQC